MKKAKIYAIILTVAFALGLLCGCTSTANSIPTTSTGVNQTASTSIRVAMVLSGYINDAGWNQSSYEGIQLAEEEFGITSAVSEAVAQPDFESTIRDYADQDYDLIICVGNEFSDAALNVAPSFPNVKFAVVNGNDALEPNVGAYRFNTPETGFLAGALAAMYSESGIVGEVGGTTQPNIQDAVKGFEAGAKYINPNIEVLTGYTETLTDVAKGKEMGMAFIEQGADVLSSVANSSSLGVIDAASENGIKYIGYNSDQYEVAPDTVMISVVQSNQFMIRAIVESVVSGSFSPELHLYGLKEGAIYLTEYHDERSPLTEEQRTDIDAIIMGIEDGSLKQDGILPKSVFEQ